MLSNDQPARTVRLSGEWDLAALPLDAVQEPVFDGQRIAECAHVQPALYPDRPYWGDHLRAINDQAWFYRRTFDLPEGTFRRARLRFEGVDYHARVWLNGQLVGEHEGAFVPFTLDVTPAIRPGENTLLVRVSAPWDRPNPRGSYPINHVLRGLVKGLYEHGEGVIPPNVNPLGIWRPVWLLLDEGVSLDRVQIRTALDGTLRLVFTATNATGGPWSGRLTAAIRAENHDGPGVTLAELLSLPPGTSEFEREVLVPEPRLWWPWDHGAPNLYRLEAALDAGQGDPVSVLRQVFGIRTVRLERSPQRFTFYVNERPVFLRGSSYMPGLYLSLCDRAWLERDLGLAREANLNLLRVHVHISPPELYDLCDRAGMLIWQDFELNWVHDPSPEFEARALGLQRDAIDMLFNHPALLTWTCHNEPTMVFAHRDNYERRPDPALYAAALAQDDTRPIFICSGQMEEDWQRAGDIHTYYGAIWSTRYTDVYRHSMRMNTEFGFEAPGALPTLRRYPDAWTRLDHLEGQIEALWAYQAALVQYHVEHLRRIRVDGSAGYVHFWLADLVPQVGCGVLDSDRLPKGGYAALKQASAPLHVALEHDGRRGRALWVFNDTMQAYLETTVAWLVTGPDGRVLERGEVPFRVEPNAACRVVDVAWKVGRDQAARVELALRDGTGQTLASNRYDYPFQPLPRPRGYPWKFDPYLGYKVFDRPGAPSLVDQSSNGLIKLIPLRLRETLAEWAMRQKLPLWVLSAVARVTKPFVQA